MKTVRLAVVGSSPCMQCAARCCKQNGHDYAVLLRESEHRRFAPWAVSVPIQTEGRVVMEKVLPYVDGRCPFLGADDRCKIYEDRPMSCREFECTKYFNSDGIGKHGRFLELNEDVRELLEKM